MRNIEKIERMHLECLQGIYFSRIIKSTNYALVFSDLIEDTYYNYCAFLKFEDGLFLQKWKEIRKDFPNNRVPALYVSPSSDLYGRESIYLTEFQKNYIDAWMILQEKQYLLGLPNNEEINVRKIASKKEFEIFVDVFTTAYSGDDPNDPYGQLSPTYTTSLLNSWECSEEYIKDHYLAFLNGNPAGVATAIRHNNLVAVYNVGTVSKYRKCGVGAAIMANIVRDLKKNETLFLQTEKGSQVEKWYGKMGFETLFLGKCYTEKEN